MNKKHYTMYLFPEDIAKRISSLSGMPPIITRTFYPVATQQWGISIATSLMNKDDTILSKHVGAELMTFDLSEFSFEDIISGNFDIPAGVEGIIMPMILGRRFELEQELSRRNIPESLLQIVDEHRKKLLWIPKTKYIEQYGASDRFEPYSYSPYHTEADEENVKAVNYLLHFLPKKDVNPPIKKATPDPRAGMRKNL